MYNSFACELFTDNYQQGTKNEQGKTGVDKAEKMNTISTFLFIYLYMYVCICLPIYLSIHPPTYLSNYPFIYVSIYLSIHLLTYPLFPSTHEVFRVKSENDFILIPKLNSGVTS